MISSIRGWSAAVRRAVNALDTRTRRRLWSPPYAVNMFCTATQVNSGHSGVISPFANRGQCCRASLDTRGSVSSLLSRSGLLTAQASTPPGSATRATGPAARMRAPSP